MCNIKRWLKRHTQSLTLSYYHIWSWLTIYKTDCYRCFVSLNLSSGHLELMLTLKVNSFRFNIFFKFHTCTKTVMNKNIIAHRDFLATGDGNTAVQSDANEFMIKIFLKADVSPEDGTNALCSDSLTSFCSCFYEIIQFQPLPSLSSWPPDLLDYWTNVQ